MFDISEFWNLDYNEICCMMVKTYNLKCIAPYSFDLGLVQLLFLQNSNYLSVSTLIMISF